MRCLVTGAAGFIGSHLCENLLNQGHQVVGVDAFIPYYPREIKESNLRPLLGRNGFQFLESDLRKDGLSHLAKGTEVVFHLAAMAGLKQSWVDFELYSSCNLLATQRLIEAFKGADALKRFIYASTSSVYGRFSSGDEKVATCPVSPYGVTKLAGEMLCHAYREEFGLPAVVLRYFSVYGPGQRPDMGYHKFVRSLLEGTPITVFGDGHQSRGNTFVADCVDATIAAVNAPVGETYNIGGGETASVWDILKKLERITGVKARIRQEEARVGDQRTSQADIAKATRDLGWSPRVGLDEGLARQVDWQRSLIVRRAA